MLTTMIFANDHDAMVGFHQRLFGLTVDAVASSPGYTVLADDGIRVSIHAVAPEVAAQIAIADPPEPRSESAFKLLFEVDDLTATCDRLIELGGHLFETSTDGVDVEGNVFRVSAAS